MPHSRAILRAYLRGRKILDYTDNGGQPQFDVDPPGAVTFDRLVIEGPPEIHLVVDAVPAAGEPTPEDTQLRVDSSGPVRRILVRALVRSYLAGKHPSWVLLQATLSLVPNAAPGKTGVRVDSFRLGSNAPVGPLAVPELVTNPADWQVVQEFESPLLEHLGLVPCAGVCPPTTARFVPACRAAGQTFPVGTVSPLTFVLRLERAFRFADQDQELTAGPLHLRLKCPQLHHRPGTLVQTLLAYDDRDCLDPATVGRWAVTLSGLPGPPALEGWNEVIAGPYLSALRTVAAGKVVSALPVLSPVVTPDTDPCHCDTGRPVPKDDGPPWLLVLEVQDRAAGPGPLRARDFSPNNTAATQAIRVRSVQPVPAQPAVVADVYAELPGFRTHDNQALRVNAILGSVVLHAARTPPQNSRVAAADWQQTLIESVRQGFVFTFRQTFVGNGRGAPQLCRAGSLDLQFVPPATGKGVPDVQEDFGDNLPLLCAAVQSAASAPAAFLPVVNLEIWLRVEVLRPGGQDDPPGETAAPIGGEPCPEAEADDPLGHCSETSTQVLARFARERALVIPLGEVGSGPVPQFTLRLREATTATQSQDLRMNLSERRAGQSAPVQLLAVVDRQPFLVARVHAPPFRGLPGADGTPEVGHWSSADAAWQLTGGSAGFPLVLPPQAVGESAAKYDPRKDPLPPPAPPLPAGLPDPEDGKALDFRLSPPAWLTLQPSFFAQNYAEAAWNLRRLLGYPGQRAPGAGIVQMQFELLYGLGCTVTYPFLRLAELAARLGAVPGPLPDRPFSLLRTDAVKEHAARFLDYRCAWARLYHSHLSRLAVLEPWDAHETQGGSDPPQLTLADGVSYQLRDRSVALQAHPILAQRLEEARKRDAAHLPPLLAGGVLWAVEFQSLLDNLLNKPRSSSGQLHRPYFSALGGWGFQKASFDNDLTTIYSDTAMGRVFYYSLERIGRIGVCWNVAKHVIVYERTVVPSRQFVGEQARLAGRPVLRKVLEYVEPIQPRRSYPDFGAEAASCGCVVGAEFPKRIYVNSRWGHDIAEGGKLIGYCIPLWRRGEDPTVYPKPQIVLRLAADPNTGADSTPCELDEPDKLFFFTRTAPGPNDPVGSVPLQQRTDAWPAVLNIDYPDEPAPTPPTVPPFDDANLDGALADGAAVEPAFSAFTWAVVPGGRSINLTAGRSTQAMGAVLRNVTMARAAPKTGTGPLMEGKKALGSARSLVQQELVGLLDRLGHQGNLTDELRARAVALVNRARQNLAAAGNGLDTQVNQLFQGPVQKVIDAADNLRQAAKDRVDQWQQLVSKQLTAADATGLLGQLRDELQRVPRPGAPPMAPDLRGEAQRVLRQFTDVFEARYRQVDAGLDQLRQKADECAKLVRQLQADATNQVERVRRVFQDALAGAQQAARPDLLRQRLKDEVDALQAQLLAGIDNMVSAGRAAVDSAFGKLGDAVRAAALAGQAAVRAAIGKLGAAAQDLDGNAINAALDKLLKDVAAAVGPAAQAADGLIASLVAVGAHEAQALTDWANGVQQQLEGVINQLPKAAKVEDIVKAVTDKLNNDLLKDLKTRGDALIGAATTGINNLATAGDILKTLDFNKLGDFLPISGGAVDQALANLANGIGVLPDLQTLQKQWGQLVGQAQDAAARLAEQLAPQLAQLTPGIAQAATQTLRLFRAFGDSPIVQGMELNRQRLGYFFDKLDSTNNQIRNLIGMTPAAALVARDGLDRLKALGVRLPTRDLLERLLPDDLSSFDFSKILPDFGGLNLSNLLPDLKMPPGAKDKVKLSHGFDNQSLRGWLQADIALDLSKPATLFSAGPVLVRLETAAFRATVRIEAGPSGAPQQTARGSIVGDWSLTVGSTPLVIFHETELKFQQGGHVQFDLKPDKVEMNGLLKILSDVVAQASSPDDGFTLRLLEDRGRPIGAEAVLELPLPDLSFGVCSITNLRFGAALRLEAVPEFAIGLRLHLGEKTAPFALIVFILGGGGWIDVRARYLPLSGRVTSSVSIAVSAGAQLGIAFGPVKGAIYAFLSFSCEFDYGGAGGTQLTLGISLLLGGEVTVFGFIDVCIQLLLELEYHLGGGIVGRGTLSIKVKICWCLTISVSVSVEYSLGGGGKSSSSSGTSVAGPAGGGALGLVDVAGPANAAPANAAPVNPYRQAAHDHLALLE